MTSGADGAPSAAVWALSDPAESAESALAWSAGFAKSGACGAGAECNASTLMVAPLSGTKVQVDEKGDAGYKDRKAASEAKVRKVLGEKTVDSAKWLAFFGSHTKKNDLADAFCMCIDKLSV